jgi:phenylpropionate dioxygenase-like ring-hydroxylating dioxygenase large terminal subunit
MLEMTVEAIERMIAEQASRNACPPGFPARLEVPTARYYDPDFAALEMERMWLRTWLFVGHVNEFPQAGSYKLFERLDRSVIITRGKDDRIRAFHNSCRHRGSAVVLEPSGRASRFACPYHGWTYGSDGALIGVTDAQDFPCLDKAALGLAPVRCEVWRGFVFINFDTAAEGLDAFVAPMARQAADFPLEQFAVKGQYEFRLDCNWKVGIDNNLEIYHVNLMHAETVAPFLEVPSFMVGLLENGHSRFFTRKKTKTLFMPKGAADFEIEPLFQTFHIGLPVFPNSIYVLDPTGFVFHSYWPDGPGRCVVDFKIFGWESVDPDYYNSEMFPVMRKVLDEDWRLFPRLQRSLESGANRVMNLSYQERALYWMQEGIDRAIGAEQIPAHLRVEPLMGPYVED